MHRAISVEQHRAYSRNNVRIVGEGTRRVVLAHGFGCDQRIWANLVPQLANRYRIVLFDHAGCGNADLEAYRAGPYDSLEPYARDLVEIVEATCDAPPVYVGHSISNSIAVIASRGRRLFEHIVMLAPSPRFLDDPPDYRGGFTHDDVKAFLDLMDQNFMGWMSMFGSIVAPDPAIAERMRDNFRATNPQALRRFARVVFEHDVRHLLGDVIVPTLVAQCERDEIVPSSVGEYLHRAIAGSTYRVLDVSGHCPHLSNPELVAALIGEVAA